MIVITAFANEEAATDGMVELSYETGIDLSKLQPSITSAVDHSLHMYGIDMFHNLHCLVGDLHARNQTQPSNMNLSQDRIRQSFYPSHYFPNETEVSISHHKGTQDHPEIYRSRQLY